LAALLGLAALALGAAAHAQALADPTRPPPAVRGGAGSPSGRGAGEPGGLVLQSVIISDTSRSAIINGEHVMLGGKSGPARLIKVSEATVVVLTGDARRTLKLFPGVTKRALGGDVDQEEEP
jgi:MSHA biogenesis protein MshK